MSKFKIAVAEVRRAELHGCLWPITSPYPRRRLPFTASCNVLIQVLERWFNNKPTVLQDKECLPRLSSKHVPLDLPGAEPSPKKARYIPDQAGGVDSALPASPAIPVRRLVASAVEAVAEQAAVTGAELLQLYRECVEFERSTTWVPQNANCAMCGGFCFAPTSDVARQLGVCGCVVATEMELADAEARLENSKAIGRHTAWTFSEILSGALNLTLTP
jgi:hypothetical protein